MKRKLEKELIKIRIRFLDSEIEANNAMIQRTNSEIIKIDIETRNSELLLKYRQRDDEMDKNILIEFMTFKELMKEDFKEYLMNKKMKKLNEEMIS